MCSNSVISAKYSWMGFTVQPPPGEAAPALRASMATVAASAAVRVVMMGSLVHAGAAQDFPFVALGAFGGGGVDEEGDFAVLDEVDDVGPAFLEFGDARGGDAPPSASARALWVPPVHTSVKPS